MWFLSWVTTNSIKFDFLALNLLHHKWSFKITPLASFRLLGNYSWSLSFCQSIILHFSQFQLLIVVGPRIHPHKNFWNSCEQTGCQSWSIHKNQFKSFVDFCSETNVACWRSQKEEERARTQTDCWRRYTRMAKCKWKKTFILNLYEGNHFFRSWRWGQI